MLSWRQTPGQDGALDGKKHARQLTPEQRRELVAFARRHPIRETARHFGVARSTVCHWVERAGRRRLDRANFDTRPSGPRSAHNRTAADIERRVLALRRQLADSALGEIGADTIRHALAEASVTPLPARSTINRILDRHGLFDRRARLHRKAPPPGWYLPEVAARKAELDSADAVLELRATDSEYEVFTIISLHGGLPGAFPWLRVSARSTVDDLIAHWRAHGRPRYAQFDNDTRFQGAHQFYDSVGRVSRLCLQLGITPVFAIPQEHGFQAAIESFNGRWQKRVAQRFDGLGLDDLRERSERYLDAARQRHAARIEAAPRRRPFPRSFDFDVQLHPRGTIIYLRRTTATGTIKLLGRGFTVCRDWPGRMVRAEVNLTRGEIRIFALRRRDPTCHKLLISHPYKLPRRRFNDRAQ